MYIFYYILGLFYEISPQRNCTSASDILHVRCIHNVCVNAFVHILRVSYRLIIMFTLIGVDAAAHETLEIMFTK